jgi:sRNA-binding regulator protein Hfq
MMAKTNPAATGVGSRGDSSQETSAEKFHAHAVQRPWLDAAKGDSISVRLLDGQVLTGRLLSHDAYCLALDQVGENEPTLVYKQAIAYLERLRRQRIN